MGRKPQRFRVTRRHMVAGASAFAAWLAVPSTHAAREDSADGCLAVTNGEMAEIFRSLREGTPVLVRP